MTEGERSGPVAWAAGADTASEGGYSKDYWDIVFEQLAKRRLFQIGLAVLAMIYASAIYAPLIANDRPYVLEAVDFKAYDAARKSLYPVSLGFGSLLKKTPEEYLESRTEGSVQNYEEALAAEREAVSVRVETLATYAPEDRRAELEAFLATVDEAIAARRAGDDARAEELAGTLKDGAKTIRSDFEAVRPGPDGAVAEEDAGKLVLRGEVSYPLAESTTAFEVFFMVLWAFVLLWPVWNPLVNRVLLGGDRERIRAWRKVKRNGVLGLSIGAAVLWWFTVGGQMTFNVAPYKVGITSGEIVATRVVFPPISYGFAETHLSEAYRPPTWKDYAEISEEGYYVRGTRVPVADPVTGFVPEAKPVDVRTSEPERNAPTRHVLGTDVLGRDLLVRSLYGGRISLAVGLVSTAILMLIGVVYGCIAGYFGGWLDTLMMRVLEIVICFPVFFLILVVVAFIGPSILNIMLVIGLVRWTGVARLARGEFLKLKEQEFVIGARAMGLSSRRIVFKHMLPNAMGPLLVAATFSIAAGILVESSLSFLGFGIQPPVASWGSLINESKSAEHWWIQIFPGLLIFVTVICYNLVGDGARDAMDPKLKS